MFSAAVNIDQQEVVITNFWKCNLFFNLNLTEMFLFIFIHFRPFPSDKTVC